MSKATGVGSIVFGAVLILVGIGAFFSGEPASQTDQGKIGIGFAIILGLAAILGGLNAREKQAAKERKTAPAPQVLRPQPMMETPLPPPPLDLTPTSKCPSCGRDIQADFVVCPYCGKPAKASCPKCGRQVEKDFVARPYCGTSLRSS